MNYRSSLNISKVIFSSFILFFVLAGRASSTVNTSDLEWRTIETEHFEIHYHPGEEWSAERVASIAEEIYGPVTEFYDYRIDKVDINLMDVSDNPGGAAYYYQNRINIDVSDYEFALRGSTDWLRNVTTHEFAHLVSLQKSMKMPLRIPAVYFQVVNFEKEKRPDVITGYPNFQLSLPFAGEIMPNWLAEGAAQYQANSIRSDIWDSHRDMILRTAVLNDDLLTLDEMAVFGKNSLRAELLYNQGFSMVRFIAEEFGEKKILKLVKEHSRFHRLGFDGACSSALGISSGELYRLWKERLVLSYSRVQDRVKEADCPGEVLAGKGFLNIFPVPDRRGGIFYLSNQGGDYLRMNLVHSDGNGNITRIARKVTSRFSLSKDGRFLAYSKITSENKMDREYNDIFIYDLIEEKEKRLTEGLRATDPEWSPDGGSIAAVVTADCSERIAIIDMESDKAVFLFDLEPGMQYYGLSWGKGGILASRFDCVSRDLVLIDPESGLIETVLATPADERDPSWNEEGKGYFYASDRTGIFNIYYRGETQEEARAVTDVLGGAFSPEVRGDTLYYQSYESEGYKISGYSGWKEVLRESRSCPADSVLLTRREDYLYKGEREGKASGAENGSDISKRMSEGKGFGIEYTKLFLFPRIMIYEKKFRLGLTLNSSDILDRQNMLASGSLNLDGEYDLALMFEAQTRSALPDFILEVYRSRKYYDYSSSLEGNVDIRYDLWDAFFTLRYELEEPTYFSWNQMRLRYNYGEYGLNINAWELYDFELGWNYYKASEISLLYDYRDIRPSVNADINPRRGRILFLEATRAYDKLSSGSFEYMFMPIYNRNNFGRYMLTYEEFIPVPLFDSSLSIYLKGGALDNNEVDDFFDFYLGSRDGLRGYSYYSIGGRKMAMGRITYRFPLFKNINKSFLFTYLASVYGGIFYEAGNAWNEDDFVTNGYKKDAGFELRLKGFNFSSYPMSASFEAAYGFDDVVYVDPFTEEDTFYEGKSWKFYGTLFYNF